MNLPLLPLLTRIVNDRNVHARFANTLSFLEYIGARKILKSQEQFGVTGDLLAHVSEEIRHAQLFKRIALSLDPTVTDYRPENLWRGQTAQAYFQGLDKAASQLLANQSTCDDHKIRINYLLTTDAIERRALVLYRDYFECLDYEPHRKLIAGILREESSHLNEIDRNLGGFDISPAVREELQMKESQLFTTWFAYDHNPEKNSDIAVMGV